MHIVIVGNGVAGVEAALTLRRLVPDWDVTVVSEESDHFFSRTALMWVFCGQLSHRDIEPYERDLYARLGLHRVRARATGLDPDRRVLELGGEPGELRYDRLLIACGSRPRGGPWPGSELRGVGHFVTIQDLEWFEKEVHGGPNLAGRPPRPDHHLPVSDAQSPYYPREVAAERRSRLCREPAVVGGGLIGIEAVEVLLAAGHRPHFFIREEWFWPMAINRAESTWIAERMREHGVQVHLEHNLERIEGDGDGNISRIHTDQGSYDADLLVVTIGVRPNTEWLEESGLQLAERSRGIQVDPSLTTNYPNVFAAGDCAVVPWFDGESRPEQLWYTARDQGRVAGQRLAGLPASHDRGIWYNSAKLMDMEYTTAGFVNLGLKGEQEWYYEEAGKVRSTTRIVVKDGRVIGFNLLGRRWDHNVLKRWIRERRTLEWVLTHLNEASFDTEFVPPLVIPRDARAHLSEPSPGHGPFQDASLPT